MKSNYPYVIVTLRDGSTREGWLVDVDGEVGTVTDGRTNTVFHLPSVEIQVIVPATHKEVNNGDYWLHP